MSYELNERLKLYGNIAEIIGHPGAVFLLSYDRTFCMAMKKSDAEKQFDISELEWTEPMEPI